MPAGTRAAGRRSLFRECGNAISLDPYRQHINWMKIVQMEAKNFVATIYVVN